MTIVHSGIACLVLGLAAPLSAADPAPFELTGPSLRINVTRGERSLPIGQVPSLSEGDRLSIRADLPEDQGARFILVSAFLRGATNPPPKDWIAFAETWKKKAQDRELTLTVPKGARQMVLFLVPDTGGAEGTLRDAVRGKPGEFVRATQDLNQASLDRSRLDSFMGAIQAQENTHPEYLRTLAPVLARSLSMKLNEDCLSKVIEMQAACLLDNRDSLVLADVHSSSMAETLTGAPTDLALQLSATREAGYGYYSPYIGVARDIARIFGAFSNPEFDYLPTLSVRRNDAISLLLNAAPSFQKPKSVMVVAMPAIEADSPPRLRSGAQGPVCAARPGAILPVEGAPLIYSTDYARDVKLALKTPSGDVKELPVTARADRGGYRLSDDSAPQAALSGSFRGHLYGQWGFDRFEGPDFTVQFPDTKGWTVDGEAPTLVAGRDNRLTLKGSAPACVESVTIRTPDGPSQSLGWKVKDANAIALTLPLAERRAGPLQVEVKYVGMSDPSVLSLKSYAEASRLDSLVIHAGDRYATLVGQRLDQVESVTAGDLVLRPDDLTRAGQSDRLVVKAGEGHPLQAGYALTAHVALRDGRKLDLSTKVAPARPDIRLIDRTITPGPARAGSMPLTILGDAVLPDDGQMTFSIAVGEQTRLAPDDVLEIASQDGGNAIRLTAENGLQLEGAHILVARLDPHALPPGMFGPLQVRLRQDAQASDWQPLATLARMPRIEAIDCEDGAAECTIRGRDLFLIDAIASGPALANAVTVAHGYTGSVVKAPRPQAGKLYLRLRDAPEGLAVVPTA
ncbi:hypothetical protein [Sphingobium lactosutens]|uniref:Alpha-2-macroglobulin domain-containing protein n=1 Tax=Sphingobium lactosutens DS20 TaxID=1331060 RepID=T0HPT2_9SPHN|nr:hypothetical protein [Sphingobium lactosutens]EQB18341.1 hypothetical protein RLDS_02735 [Sphingobium lactosutens DS20]